MIGGTGPVWMESFCGLYLDSAAQWSSWLENYLLRDPLEHNSTLSGSLSEPIRSVSGAITHSLCDEEERKCAAVLTSSVKISD